MFTTVSGIFAYEPTYRAYHRQLLEELYADNVMYVEMRTGLSPVNSSFRLVTYLEILISFFLRLVVKKVKD